jgi:2',3'-cyclic-nucleotide 2'-phosphodiesterase / 3'-nucleotidase / 5'-nucleotidase
MAERAITLIRGLVRRWSAAVRRNPCPSRWYLRVLDAGYCSSEIAGMIKADFRGAAALRALRALLIPAAAAVAAACARPGAGPAPLPAGGSAAATAGASTRITAADTMTLVLLGTTDVHGRLYNHDYYTGRETDHGLALLKPLVDSVRAAHPAGRTFLFDSGDLLQGNPLGFVYARQYPQAPNPIIRAMNLMGYDAAAIGNHEFNYGLDHLANAIELAEFPFVSANIFRVSDDAHAYDPYVLIPVPTPAGDTLLIGVTGNTPPGVHVWDRHNVEGILSFRDVVSSVRRVVAEMRRRGADIVIVLSHGGLEGTSYDLTTTGLTAENVALELARAEPGIDVIFLGHTHRELADTTVNGVLLTQARNWASSLAKVTLTAERTSHGNWRAARKRGEILRPTPGRVDHAFLDSLRWEHERTVAWVNARIGTATEAMPAREGRVRDVAVIDFINEVQKRTAGTQLSAAAPFVLDAGLPQGDVTIADIAALYPYDNTLKAIRISGAQLRAYLEKAAEYYAGWPAAPGGTVTNFSVPGYNFDIVSGIEYAIDISRPVGQRITELRFEGQPVRDDQSFTMALNNYRQSGGGGYDMIAGAEVVYDRAEDVRELLIEEVRRRGTIRPADYHRPSWRLLPEPAAAVALQEQAAREVRAAAATGEPRKRLRVLTLNDFHGRLEAMRPSWAEGRPVGGAAALATYLRQECEGFDGACIMLHGGDVMQGTPVSNLTQGRSTIDFHNMVGWHAGAIGNHEFDWGLDVMLARIADSQSIWLAANIRVAGTDSSPPWARDTATVLVNGVRVGVIGLATPETKEKTAPDVVAGLDFLDGAETMNRLVPVMRRTGADFVIVVAHEGATCNAEMTACEGTMVDWAQRTTERPDLIVAGHTHEVVRWVENGIPIIETGMWGTRYGVVDLERVSGDSVAAWIRGTPVAWADAVTPDSAVAAMVAAALEEVGPRLLERIGEAAGPLERGAGENAMGRLIADGMRWKTGADVALMNAGGVRAALQAGPITWGDLYSVQPFGNMLVVLDLRGADLRAAIEHTLRGVNEGEDGHFSGIVVEYDPTRPVGSRIVSARLANGSQLQDDATYRVATNDFVASGVGDGFISMRRALRETATGLTDLDVLIEYVRSLPQPIRAPSDRRLIRR